MALDDLGLQVTVALLQRLGPLLDPALEFLAGLVAVQRGQDVLGDEGQQCALLLAVGFLAVVALHDDRAADAVVAAHRHAQPVAAVRAMALVEIHPELLADLA